MTLAAATVGAPLIGVFLGACGYVLAGGGWSEAGLALEFVFATTLYVGCLLGLPAMVVAGLPIHTLLYRTRARNAWVYAASGAVVGALAGNAAFSLVLHNDFHEAGDPQVLYGLAILTGAMSSAIFWFIRRPDRDAANPANTAP